MSQRLEVCCLMGVGRGVRTVGTELVGMDP